MTVAVDGTLTVQYLSVHRLKQGQTHGDDLKIPPPGCLLSGLLAATLLHSTSPEIPSHARHVLHGWQW